MLKEDEDGKGPSGKKFEDMTDQEKDNLILQGAKPDNPPGSSSNKQGGNFARKK
jgi:hypothetical protein